MVKKVIKKVKRYIYFYRIKRLLNKYNFYSSIYKKSIKICSIKNSKEILLNNNIVVDIYNISLIQYLFFDFAKDEIIKAVFNKKVHYSINYTFFIVSNKMDKLFLDNISLFKCDIINLSNYKRLLDKINNL